MLRSAISPLVLGAAVLLAACGGEIVSTGTDSPREHGCGNGAVDPQEECDGTDVGEHRCDASGFAYSHGIACDDTCTIDTSGCKGKLAWARSFGGASDDALGDSAMSVAVDATRNVYIAGRVTGIADFGGGPTDPVGERDAFLLKLNASGQHLWSRRWGTSGDDAARAVAVDGTGRVYVCGQFTGTLDLGLGPLKVYGKQDLFVARLDGDGVVEYASALGGDGDDYCVNIATNPDGTVLVSGVLSGAIDLGAGVEMTDDFDGFIATLDVSGAIDSVLLVGGSGRQGVSSARRHPDGDIVATGAFEGTLDLGESVQSTYGDAFIVRMSPAGDIVYRLVLSGEGNDSGADVRFDAKGTTYVAGQATAGADLGGNPLSSGDPDAFVLALDSTGAIIWSRTFGTAGFWDAAYALDVTPAGEVVAGGAFAGAADAGGGEMPALGEGDAFFLRLDSQGDTVYSQRFGNDMDIEQQLDRTLSVAFDPAGGILVAGQFGGSCDLGGSVLTSAGSADSLVFRYDD